MKVLSILVTGFFGVLSFVKSFSRGCPVCAYDEVCSMGEILWFFSGILFLGFCFILLLDEFKGSTKKKGADRNG